MRNLSDQRILLTHPADRDDADLVNSLQLAGAEIIHQPLIETKTIPFEMPNLESFDWIFFSSGVAVSSFLKTTGLFTPRIAAVGSMTAKLLDNVTFVSPMFDGVSAVQALNAAYALKDKAVLWPCGNQSNPEIKKAFDLVNAKLTSLVVYETHPKSRTYAPDFLQTLAMIVFTSPSAVDAFQSEGPLPKIICIGPSTAKRAQEKLGRVDGVAIPHTYSGLATLILQ